MQDELVSIITPCYNVANTLIYYLQSILNQTYKNIEVIAVDDGSTDDTADILKEYVFIFAKYQMKLEYIYQKNAGLGAAINTGLKYVNGEYLCWADPDDFYMSDSIAKRLEILRNYPEYAVVSSDAYVFRADDLKNPIKREAERFTHRYEETQFEYLLTEQSHFCAGCHMIRMSAFDQVNPEREIYPARRGQNWQLLLPVYYKYKRFYLDEPLYGYIVYPKSMSSGDVTEEKELQRWKEHEEIINQTLRRIPLDDKNRERYVRLVNVRYAKKRLYTAIDYRDKELLKEQYLFLKQYNEDTDEIRILYLRNSYLLWKVFYKLKEIIAR